MDDPRSGYPGPGLYVQALQYSDFQVGPRAGERDYAIAFQVCGEDVDGERRAVVEGDLVHITELDPALLAILEAAELECSTNAGPEETVESCRAFFPASVEDGLVIEAGTPLGTAGGTGMTDYAPGLDFNLLDTRFANNSINPDRLGAEEGPGKWFRYGACVYEYFAEPARTAYMSKVGQNGDLRVDEGAPCGTLSFDKVGSAAGFWIREDKAALDINDDLVEVLEHLLVLGPHPVFPGTRQVVSTEMAELASWSEGGTLVEFEPDDVDDVNTAFFDMEPGTVYCIDGAGFGNEVPHSYYLELSAGADELTFERLDESCAGVATGDRGFSDAAMVFVR